MHQNAEYKKKFWKMFEKSKVLAFLRPLDRNLGERFSIIGLQSTKKRTEFETNILRVLPVKRFIG